MKYKIVRNVVSGESLTYERFRVMYFNMKTEFDSDWEYITNCVTGRPIEFTSDTAAMSFVTSNFGVRYRAPENDEWETVIEFEPKKV